MYNAATKKWEMAPSMTKGRCHFNLVVVEDELYAVGGAVENLSIEKLSKVSGTWQLVAKADEIQNGCCAAAVGSKIYVFGGYLGFGVLTSTWNAFDVTTEQWANASIPAQNRKISSRNQFYLGMALTVPSSLDNGKKMTWND